MLQDDDLAWMKKCGGSDDHSDDKVLEAATTVIKTLKNRHRKVSRPIVLQDLEAAAEKIGCDPSLIDQPDDTHCAEDNRWLRFSMLQSSQAGSPFLESSMASFNAAFTLGGELGSGAFSQVFQGTRKKGGQRVAVKMLRTDKDDGMSVAQIKAEMDVMRELNHAHVLRVQGAFWAPDNSEVMLVAQLATGGELFSWIRCVPAGPAILPS